MSYKECIDSFTEYLKSYAFFSASDLDNLHRYWDYATARKNKKIIIPNHVCHDLKFICKGHAKYYTEDASGKYILSFLSDFQFCAHVESFYNQTETNNGAIGTTDIYGLRITHSNFQKLIKERPAFDLFFKKLIFDELSYLKDRVKALLSLDARERYQLLESEFPDVFDHFKLVDISNYLGIKPETLVRLRKSNNLPKVQPLKTLHIAANFHTD